MPNELRLRADGVAGALDAALTTTDTVLSSPALADLPAVTSTHHAVLSLFVRDSATGRITKRETVWVTAHTAAATTATVLRAQEGTTALAWAVGDRWVHGPTATDFLRASRSYTIAAAGSDTLTLGAVPFEESLLISVDGVLKREGVHYTVAGKVVTFPGRLLNGQVVSDHYLTTTPSPAESILTVSAGHHVFRLRAANLTLAHGAPVTSWPDFGTGGTDATSVGTAPKFVVDGIGGKPAVSWVGGSGHFTSPRQASNRPRTVVAVARFTDFAAFRSLIGSSANGGRHFRPNTAAKMELLSASTTLIATSPTVLTAGTNYILTVTYDGTGNFAFFVNGAAAGSGVNNVAFTAGLTTQIGASVSVEPMLGLIAEVIEQDAVLTSAELTSLHSALGSYYGITVS